MINIGFLIYTFFLFNSSSDQIAIYEWRGKDRSGICNETNLLKEWPAEGPEEIWSVSAIGNGFVSPVFKEDRFYITGEFDSILFLQCYDLKGLKLWETRLGREWVKSYPGSRSAPTIAGDLIYVGSGYGNLWCVDSRNGKILWSKDLVVDIGGVLPLHGHSEAALVDGDKVFWMAGGKVNNVVALNRFNGELIWSGRGFGEPSAYNSPKLIALPRRHVLVTFSSYHLMGFDASTGELLWQHEQDNTPVAKRIPGLGDTHCNTVLYENGAIYYAAGDGNCGVKLALSEDGSNIREVWRCTGFDGYMGGIIKLGDHIYGGATARPQLKSVSAKTGVVADSLNAGSGALIAADNMLYYYNQKGELILCSYNNGNIERVSAFRIKKGNGPHFSHPVINKGVLYQRHGNVLMAFNIKK